MTSEPGVNIVGVLSGVRSVAGGVVVAASGFAHSLDPATVLVVVGAVIFAIATWRRDTRNVLRQQNKDLADRNATLEADLAREQQRAKELAARPNLDQHAQLLTTMIERLNEHDTGTTEVGKEILEGLREVATNIHAQTTAITVWASGKAQEAFPST